MDFAIIDWIIDQSGVAMFAAFALYINWHQHKDGLKREETNADTHRQDKIRIVDVLQDVARSNAELCQLIRELREEMRDEE